LSNSDSSKAATDRGHESYANDAKAQRVILVLDDSSVPSGGTGFPVRLTNSTATIGSVQIKDGTATIGTVKVIDGVGIKIYDTSSGTYKGLQWNAEAPQVCSQDYGWAVAEGDISGHTPWMKIGYGTTTANVESDIWSKGDIYVFPTVATSMSVASTDNVNDKSGGTGALKVTLYYLDESWNSQTEEVTLNGTNYVNTVATSIYRINGFRVTSAGSTGKSAGNIILVDKETKTKFYGFITAGFTRSRNSVYTVPLGKSLYVTQFLMSWAYASNSTHYARMYTRATYNEGVRTPGIFYPYSEAVCSNNSIFVPLSVPTRFSEKTDIKVSVLADFLGIVGCTLRGWLE